MVYNNGLEIYLKQLEDTRLKQSNKSLRNNNRALLQGKKLIATIRHYKKKYGDLD